MHNAFEPRLLHPLRHRVGRKAEPAVGIFFTQELQLMRCKIDDQEPTLGAQYAGSLADGMATVVEKVQHLVDDDDIEGIAWYRKIEDVALPDAAIAYARMVEPTAGKGQHLATEIDAETALDFGTEQFENASRPGAEIEQGTKRAGKQQGTNLCLDCLIWRVKLADTVPLGGVPAEIVLRRPDPRSPHTGKSFTVARDDRIGGVERSDQVLHHGSRRTMFGAAEKRPRTLTEALHQLRLRQQFKMARYPRLRLAQDFRELRHGELRFGQQTENAQAGLLAGGLEGGIQIIKGNPRHHGGTLPNCVGQHSRTEDRHKD